MPYLKGVEPRDPRVLSSDPWVAWPDPRVRPYFNWVEPLDPRVPSSDPSYLSLDPWVTWLDPWVRPCFDWVEPRDTARSRAFGGGGKPRAGEDAGAPRREAAPSSPGGQGGRLGEEGRGDEGQPTGDDKSCRSRAGYPSRSTITNVTSSITGRRPQ